jgi:hypothetical protein
MDNERLLERILELDGYGLIVTDEDLLRETLDLPPSEKAVEEVIDDLFSKSEPATK